MIVNRQFKSANEMSQVTAIRNTIHLLGLTSTSDQFATLVMTSFVDTCKQYMKSLSLEVCSLWFNEIFYANSSNIVNCTSECWSNVCNNWNLRIRTSSLSAFCSWSTSTCRRYAFYLWYLVLYWYCQIESEFGAERCFRRHIHCYHGSALRVNVTMSKRDVRQVCLLIDWLINYWLSRCLARQKLSVHSL